MTNEEKARRIVLDTKERGFGATEAYCAAMDMAEYIETKIPKWKKAETDLRNTCLLSEGMDYPHYTNHIKEGEYYIDFYELENLPKDGVKPSKPTITVNDIKRIFEIEESVINDKRFYKNEHFVLTEEQYYEEILKRYNND